MATVVADRTTTNATTNGTTNGHGGGRRGDSSTHSPADRREGRLGVRGSRGRGAAHEGEGQLMRAGGIHAVGLSAGVALTPKRLILLPEARLRWCLPLTWPRPRSQLTTSASSLTAVSRPPMCRDKLSTQPQAYHGPKPRSRRGGQPRADSRPKPNPSPHSHHSLPSHSQSQAHR